jgi:hypothetical protein
MISPVEISTDSALHLVDDDGQECFVVVVEDGDADEAGGVETPTVDTFSCGSCKLTWTRCRFCKYDNSIILKWILERNLWIKNTLKTLISIFQNLNERTSM